MAPGPDAAGASTPPTTSRPLAAFLLDRPWNRGPALPGLSHARRGGASMPEVICCGAERQKTAAEAALTGEWRMPCDVSLGALYCAPLQRLGY